MYVINQDKNDLRKILPVTFAEAGFTERKNLQEWIAKNPSCLGEELLIVQKEFAGFSETKERLDLLALDKAGNLVIIENKLDSTGKNVTWQALKYVSYCSSLSVDDIETIYTEYLKDINSKKKAKDMLADFFDSEEYSEKINIGYSQRIILVSGSYRKEVTSTVMWLLNNGINIACFKATPYKLNNNYIIDFRQIIPLEDAEEFMIKIAEKQKKEILNQRVRGSRQEKNESFWKDFLNLSSKSKYINHLTANLTPSSGNWIPISLGKGDISLNLVVSSRYVRVEVYINRGEKKENKRVFDLLKKNKKQIEAEIGTELEWERMDNNVTSRIKLQNNKLSIYNQDNHNEAIEFLLEGVKKMHPVFVRHIRKLI